MILKATGKPESLITTVTDRPGHDRRYALSSAKVESETGWRPQMPFEEGLAFPIGWYRRTANGWGGSFRASIRSITA
jgi:dTDP-glucose 4,6-dehydratase